MNNKVKVGQLKKIYNYIFDCVHCNLMDGWWMYEMVIYVFQRNLRKICKPSKNLQTINSEVAIQCSDRTINS